MKFFSELDSLTQSAPTFIVMWKKLEKFKVTVKEKKVKNSLQKARIQNTYSLDLVCKYVYKKKKPEPRSNISRLTHHVHKYKYKYQTILLLARQKVYRFIHQMYRIYL